MALTKPIYNRENRENKWSELPPEGEKCAEKLVCGVDEAGRGPLAGPVTAAAVILPGHFPTELLNDSKKLNSRQRDEAAKVIRQEALAYGIGWAWPDEIDRLNIHHATLLAMKRALEELCLVPELVLVDGLFVPKVVFPCQALVKGDTYVPVIQAASILAKTTRDEWMERYALVEPLYKFEQHKGYPTKLHRDNIKQFGPSAIQRKSFKIS
jgi:ribonuclease HII